MLQEIPFLGNEQRAVFKLEAKLLYRKILNGSCSVPQRELVFWSFY